ncbi:hypothetical protein CAPTEDRAFT_202914 [Capitella teleta]|uniref:Endonuclease/exonuclease/phosphatase domain-containing protein n=1 Tax=Capitella teleta TaxID=283909 RepID=R7TVD5_CAPTE|nr:hypothetical protein CAPTEDRAFT_202914 [Capitella teleta]|eukprot:ELT97547.1 hypothetical protein CAPTEDRAFT_202914 [Capitella teleta]
MGNRKDTTIAPLSEKRVQFAERAAPTDNSREPDLEQSWTTVVKTSRRRPPQMYLRNHSLMTTLTPKKTNTKTTMGTTLNLGSWNSRGHGPDRLIYIEHLLQKCNILLIQEHWLFDSELSKLAYNSSTEITVMGSSGMDPEKLLVGRPYGGCALLYKTCLRCSITPIPVDSRRIFACIIEMVGFTKFILINAYMPCDSHNIVLNDEYKEILNDVESVIVLHHEIDHVIIGGDLNTDISRVRSVHSATGAQSVLDHFIVSENLFGSIESYLCLHEGDNLSDHLPVCLNLDVKASFAPQSNAYALNCPSWQRATVQDKAAYQLRLKELLREGDIPFDVFSCRPFECVCEDHGRMIEQYYSDVMSAMITASKECIPSRSKKKAAGWSTYVSHHQEESIFWHRIWLSSGRPRTGWVQDIRKKTRAQYKRISRWVLRNQGKLSADRMAQALSKNNSRDLWREVKKLKGGSYAQPRVVDEVEGAKDVCELFRQKYEDLYSSVSLMNMKECL